MYQGAESAKRAGFFVCACLDEYYACDHEKLIACADMSFADYDELTN